MQACSKKTLCVKRNLYAILKRHAFAQERQLQFFQCNSRFCMQYNKGKGLFPNAKDGWRNAPTGER